jgi:hypothetical protein
MFTSPALLPEGTIPLRAQLEPLGDTRPESEKRALRAVTNISEQVTAVLLKDFRSAKLFEQLDMLGESHEPSDILLRGELVSFTWRSRDHVRSYLPPFLLMAFFGYPVGSNVGHVTIRLEVINAKTQQRLARYDKSDKTEAPYTAYNQVTYRESGGQELGEALRVVLESLKDALLADRQRLLGTR